MRLLTLPGVFRPRSDSWMLAKAVAERVKPGDHVLDPFTGSGVLALAAAKNGADATAVDISRRAVACARVNAWINGVAVRTVRSSTLDPLDGQRFDLIAANPPYLPGPDRDANGAARAWEGGPDGRRFIDRLCREAPKRLREGGRLLLTHSSVCDEEATFAALTEAGMVTSVIVRHTGPLGPLLAERAEELRRTGRDVGNDEEILVFEAVLP
jgi:release factor glutamine methyltransferase